MFLYDSLFPSLLYIGAWIDKVQYAYKTHMHAFKHICMLLNFAKTFVIIYSLLCRSKPVGIYLLLQNTFEKCLCFFVHAIKVSEVKCCLDLRLLLFSAEVIQVWNNMRVSK